MKQFTCYWDDGYSFPQTTKELIKFFSEDNGYDLDTIAEIASLSIGQIVDLSDPSGIHIIERIEDFASEN